MSVNHAPLMHRTGLVLVAIDLQEKLAAAMDSREDVVAAAGRLLAVCGIVGAPAIVTRQYPEGLGDTVPELASSLEQADEGATVVDKTTFCACEEPAFLDALRGTGRRQVLIAGMETHICVTQTALVLQSLGYQVFVAADACTSRRAADHAIALDRLRHAGVIVTTSESAIYELVGRAGTEEFRRVLSIVKG